MRLTLPYKAIAWAILAEVSYVLCFPLFDLPLLSLIFFPALLFCVHALGERPKQALLIGLLTSEIAAVLGLYWIVYAAQNFGGFPLPVALLLLLLFGLIAEPQMLAFLWLAQRVRFSIEKLPLNLRPLFWAALYVSLEYFAHFLKIFPESLGITMVHDLRLAQLASLGGLPMLSFMPLFLGASLYYLRKNGRAALPSVAVALALIGFAHLWGESELRYWRAKPTENIRVGLIQHNMDEMEREFLQSSARNAVNQVVGKLLTKTSEMAKQEPRPDLIVWPETAYPITFPTPGADISKQDNYVLAFGTLITELVSQTKVPLLFGGYGSAGGKDFNAGILITPDGKVHDWYRKNVLLMFGEYFPGDAWFPDLKKLNPIMGDFGRGPGPYPISLPWKGSDLLLGVNICYEAILPEYMIGYARAGSRLFINLAKDSWFGNTSEPWGHFLYSVPRSIEHRIPMVRSTNTGLSGLILPTGETKIISPPFQEAYTILDVPLALEQSRTLYTRFGDWFAYTMILLSLGMAAIAYRRAPWSLYFRKS